MDEIIIDRETMGQIARYEQDFEEYLMPESGRVDIKFPDRYAMTAEDLIAAVQGILAGEKSVSEVLELWYFMLAGLKFPFGIPEEFRNAGEIRGLPISGNDALLLGWERLGDILTAAEERGGDEEPAAELSGLRELLEDLERFLREESLPPASRSFSVPEKERFLSDFSEASRVSDANETELLLCRAYTRELAAQGSETALRVLGRSSYGGNRLFPCNWETARDCLTLLYERTEDPQCIGSLGCIWYYGRCSGGVPDYERAYRAFSASAAGGFHEGMYRLGDMFRFGCGCKKNETAAKSLYELVYHDCREQLPDGNNGDLAAAACRMGDICLYGIREEKDPIAALIYYTQAKYFLKRKECRDYDDDELEKRLEAALAETETRLPEDFHADCQVYRWAEPFRTLVRDGYRAELTIEQREDGSSVFRASRIPYPGRLEARPILLNLPLTRSCILSDSVTLECEEAEAVFVSDRQGSIRFDYCRWLPPEHATEFYYDGRRQGRIVCDRFLLYPENG